jgi:hypothetical protein
MRVGFFLNIYLDFILFIYIYLYNIITKILGQMKIVGVYPW